MVEMQSSRCSEAVLKERQRIALWIAGQRIRRPDGEAEEHVNDVLAQLTSDIYKGAHLRD